MIKEEEEGEKKSLLHFINLYLDHFSAEGANRVFDALLAP